MFHIVMGLPGTGKTTATIYLTKNLPAVALRVDAILYQMSGKKDSPAAGRTLYPQIDEAYNKLCGLIRIFKREYPESNCVVEGAFRFAKQRKKVLDTIASIGGRHSLLLLTARREICHDRILSRNAANISRCTVAEYEKARTEFEDVKIPCRRIDNSGSVAELHKVLDAYMSKSRGPALIAPARP